MGTIKHNEGHALEMDGEKKTWRERLDLASVYIVVRKTLATDPDQTTDDSHKLSECFTSLVGLFLTMMNAVLSLSQSMRGPHVEAHAKIFRF